MRDKNTKNSILLKGENLEKYTSIKIKLMNINYLN